MTAFDSRSSSADRRGGDLLQILLPTEQSVLNEQGGNSIGVFDGDSIDKLHITALSKEELHRKGIDSIDDLVYGLGHPDRLVGVLDRSIAETLKALDGITRTAGISSSSETARLEETFYGESGFGFSLFGQIIRIEGTQGEGLEALRTIGERFGVPIGKYNMLTRSAAYALFRLGIRTTGDLLRATDEQILQSRKFQADGLVEVHFAQRKLRTAEANDPVVHLGLSKEEPSASSKDEALARLRDGFSTDVVSLADSVKRVLCSRRVEVNDFAFYCTMLPYLEGIDDPNADDVAANIAEQLLESKSCIARCVFTIKHSLYTTSTSWRVPLGESWDKAVEVLLNKNQHVYLHYGNFDDEDSDEYLLAQKRGFTFDDDSRTICMTYPTLKEWLNVLSDMDSAVFTDRLKSMNYALISHERGISTDEAINRVLSAMSRRPILREDLLAEIYDSYDWHSGVFSLVFDMDTLSVGYLDMITNRTMKRHERKPMACALMDESIDPSSRIRLEDELHRLDEYMNIVIDGQQIPMRKMAIIDHLMSNKSVDGWMSIKRLKSLYDNVLEENGVENHRDLKFGSMRQFETFIDVEDPHILSVPYPVDQIPSHGSLKWLPIEDMDFWPLVDALEGLSDLNFTCSCDVFFSDRAIKRIFRESRSAFSNVRDVIRTLGIEDEYMLHRILQRYTPWLMGVDLLETPYIAFGDFD